jgi:hypothetical protein
MCSWCMNCGILNENETAGPGFDPGPHRTDHPWLSTSVEWDSKPWFRISCVYARASKIPHPGEKHE